MGLLKKALVLNAIQRDQFGKIKLQYMARTIRNSKPPTNIDVTAMLSRPLAEIFQKSLPTGEAIPVTQEQLEKEYKAIMSQAVSFPAYRGGNKSTRREFFYNIKIIQKVL